MDSISKCISFIKNRYKEFLNEKEGYKYIEEGYTESNHCLRTMAHFQEEHTFATNIQIFGIDPFRYKKIKKAIKEIFGDRLFDLVNW
jgi:hypothetical protein